ncbi:PREDICTED: biofilm and cell wall regulator 1-like, partial [Rhagoletis zephyria]|uniref:biofilm and cell wall regulator 1-like n=1 Tax=Rhagoletis zephyria TaxID=28612 RepID=UPI0008115FA3
MATQFQNIEQEMKGLATELATLRLPHKLNQYRVYERKLRSVEKQIKEVAESDDNLQKRLEAELTQLQSTLDRAVLCGVSQCFICGGNNSDVQLGSPKKFPTTVAYSRSVSAHANYANNQQRGKLPFENGSSRNSNRQYGTQISYHGKVGNNVAEKGVSSPPPPPPDIVPTLLPSPQQQHPTVTSSPSPSLSPSRSLTPSPSPSPTPSSPAPTASPLPLPFEGNDEKEKETSNDTSAAKEVVIPLENGKSSNENIGKGTSVEVALSTPEKTTTTTTTTTTKISTPPASPKIARTASP